MLRTTQYSITPNFYRCANSQNQHTQYEFISKHLMTYTTHFQRINRNGKTAISDSEKGQFHSVETKREMCHTIRAHLQLLTLTLEIRQKQKRRKVRTH